MPDLISGQYAIGDLLLGKGTQVIVSSFDPGSPEFTNGDVSLPGEDGVLYGRDTISGPVFAIEMTIDTTSPEDARTVWRQLQGKWRDPALRSSPLAVTTWSSCYQGGVPVRAYGRPRKLDLADGQYLRAGRVDVQAEFQAADWRWYSEVEHSVSLSLMPSDLGSGIVWPVTWPVTWGTYTESTASSAVNAGTEDTYPVISFKGPVTAPSIEFVGLGLKISYSGSIAFDETLTIDTRPWARTAINNFGASLAGGLSGNRLAEFVLPPGATTLAYRGTDLSGASRCTVRWRDAYSTL